MAPCAYALCRPRAIYARFDGTVLLLLTMRTWCASAEPSVSGVVVLDTDCITATASGNFYDRDDVLYVSIPGDPTNFFPGVGRLCRGNTSYGRRRVQPQYLPLAHGSSEAVFFETVAGARPWQR